MIDALYNWFDDRLGISGGGRKMLNKIFPDHWSFMIGEIALYSFIVLLGDRRLPHALLRPLEQGRRLPGLVRAARGQPVSEAFASTVNLSFAVRGGLLMRQMHHWAANIFVGSIVVHMLRIFFTGAFRRPRELNWIIGSTMLILAIFNGFLGYSLPDDLVSGTGIRIAFSIVESLPLIGSYLAFFLFGGNFPGDSIIPSFFVLHVLDPAGDHRRAPRRPSRHARPPEAHPVPGAGPQAPERRRRADVARTSSPRRPASCSSRRRSRRCSSALFQINPIWLYGPYVPYKVSYAVQPDWYMGWLDGALRIMPSWEIVIGGHMIPNAFFPAILLPGITFGVLQMWPFIEAKLTKDNAEHQLLDRRGTGRNAPPSGRPSSPSTSCSSARARPTSWRTTSSISLNVVLTSFRVLVFVVPAIVFPVTYRICKELQEVPTAGKRKRANVVLRTADGGYATVLSEERPGDAVVEPDPIPLDEEVELVPAMAGALAAGNGLPEEPETLAATAGPAGERPPRGGIFRIPRDYR